MIIKGGTVILENGIKEIDIRIKGDKTIELGQKLKPVKGEEEIDARGKYILPGIIDSHTHFQLHSRGTATADNFYHGSISAACGGVTTIIDYADQLPGSMIDGLEKRTNEAEEAVIDYNFHLVLNNSFSPAQEGKELYRLKDRGITSVKIFTTYQGLYMLSDEKIGALLQLAKDAGILVTVHAEDNEIIADLEKVYRKKDHLSVEYHPDIRPARAEAEAIERLSIKAMETKAPLYIVHLSSAEGFDRIKKAREKGIKIFVETTPHYLLLTRKNLAGSAGSLNFMTPPLRDKKDNRIIWQGVACGAIDVIATDHCAFNIKQKMKGTNSLDTLPGIPGVETMLPLVYSYGVVKERISLIEMSKLLSTNPAKIFGLYPRKGVIAPGGDADFVIYDPDPEWQIKAKLLHSRAGYTPYEGFKVKGKPVMTILRGNIIVKDNNFVGEKSYGKFIRAGNSVVY